MTISIWACHSVLKNEEEIKLNRKKSKWKTEIELVSLRQLSG
jgi:hypothetical protein